MEDKIKEALKSLGFSGDYIERTISEAKRIAGAGEVKSDPEKDTE